MSPPQLHGATALLQSRIAVMQGDRIKLLTYLSMAYLPITTVAVSRCFGEQHDPVPSDALADLP